MLLLALALVSSSFAVGTATVTKSEIWVLSQLQRKVLSIAVVGGTAGAFTDYVISASGYQITGWHLYSIQIIPGSPAPNSGFSVTLNDGDATDILGGLGAFHSALEPTLVNIANSTAGEYPVVRGDLTLSISNMGVSSCTLKVVLVFVAQAK